MKKQSILFFALLAAVSCQKENTQDIAPVFDSNVELRASFDEQSSRIATEDGLTFSLEEGKEQIGVYIQNDGMNALENVLYTAGTADEQGWISFTTQMPVQVQSTSKFFAYAPYSATTVDVSGSTEGGATDGGAIEPAAAGSGWNGKRAINLPDLQEQPAAGVKTDIAKYYSVVARSGNTGCSRCTRFVFGKLAVLGRVRTRAFRTEQFHGRRNQGFKTRVLRRECRSDRLFQRRFDA